jgi:hypothetical protein
MEVVMKLSEHFTLEELCLSQFAVRNNLDNNPSFDVIQNLTALCEHTLEPLRQLLEVPIHVDSGYRSSEVNKGIGGATDSQHILGQAADIIVPTMPVEELFQFIAKNVPFDQLIQEGTWVHVSYRTKARGQALRAIRDETGTHYQPAWIAK